MYNVNMDSNTEHREAFVIYVPNMGFVKNKSGDYAKEFTRARLFGRRVDADNCIKSSAPRITNACVIPVQMTLDPKQLFKAILKGS